MKVRLLALVLGCLLASVAQAQNHLVVAVPYRIRQFNPLELANPVSRIVFSNLGRALTVYRYPKKVGLDLAQTYFSDPGGKYWNFIVRSGISFPSGRELNARSVRDSLLYLKKLAGRQTDDSVVPFWVREKLTNIQDIKIVLAAIEDPVFRSVTASRQIQIILKKRDPNFDAFMSSVILPDSQICDTLGYALGRGSNYALMGPYQLAGKQANDKIMLVAVRNYFEKGKPIIQRLELRYYPTAKAALRALRYGDLQVIAIPTLEQLEKSLSDPSLISKTSPLSNLYKEGPWKLYQPFWSEPENPGDRLHLGKIIIRRVLQTDKRFDERFELSGTVLLF